MLLRNLFVSLGSLLVLVLGFGISPARADILFYTLPGGRATIALQGSASGNPGGTSTFTHPKFGRIHFDSKSVDIRKIPTMQTQFTRLLSRSAGDADKCMEAAQWALRHGLLPQFHTAVEQALKHDPNHIRARLVKKLKAQMDADLGSGAPQIQEMRQLVGRASMKIAESPHFVLMHDTPDTPIRGKLTRADERIKLLETVYECFLLRFYAYGVELEIPREKLKVVLFNEYEQYLAFAKKLDPSLTSASGFWSSDNNTAVFYDHGTNAQFKALAEFSQELQKLKTQAQRQRAANAADIVRLADTLRLLVEIERENSDIEVVSHEITHQMAGNTGLLPRYVQVPSWVHEGLATYFETPNGASWGGVGAVNSSRLEFYRVLAPDREHSNLDFIVGDQIFDYAATHTGKVHGYAQAWALTHFLMEKHFEKFMSFYRRLGEMPPDLRLSADAVNALFDESLGIDRSQLDGEWRAYMGTLQTDLEVILDER
ncbi:MAG: DUF1570 domain-containing protein [Pirellulaceae bacterium]